MHSTINGIDERGQAQSPLRVLVVEDTSFVREAIVETLVRYGHTVCEAENGQRALACFAENAIDLILLDIVLPDTDGFRLCVQIRAQSAVPIMLLTSLNHIDDILHGFEVGADDYITKPFVACELLSRIAAIMRRVGGDFKTTGDLLTVGDLTLNQTLGTATVAGQAVDLTPIEGRLLRYMMERADRPVAKDELFQEVWGYESVGGTNLVEAAVRRLRTKIEADPSEPARLQTVHGIGYKLNRLAMAQTQPTRSSGPAVTRP